MSKGRAVTERDFRQPAFVDANPEDYEFRDDGKVVRKDRWETAVHKIAIKLGFPSRKGWEIDEVVAVAAKAAEISAASRLEWIPAGERLPESSDYARIQLSDGSVLIDAVWIQADSHWLWNGNFYGSNAGLLVTHWAIQ